MTLASQTAGRGAGLHELERFSRLVQDAWHASALGELSPDATEYLLYGASEARLSPRMLPHGPTLVLIVSGLVRTFTSRGVRQVTTRYSSDSDFVGIPYTLRESSEAQGEVLIDTHMVRLVPSRLRELVRRDPQASWLVTAEILRLHDATVEMACANTFQSVRQRVARHLLDLAVRDGGALVVTASHQDIADAIGSVREVVSRAVGALKSEALVERSDSKLILLRPAALHQVCLQVEDARS